MWPNQRLDSDADSGSEIDYSTQIILKVARDMSIRNPFAHRFVAFPLFIASIASNSVEDRTAGQKLMRGLEKSSLGSNTQAMRQLLEKVNERQNQQSQRSGPGRNSVVDFMEVMTELGQDIVHFGF